MKKLQFWCMNCKQLFELERKDVLPEKANICPLCRRGCTTLEGLVDIKEKE